MWDFACSKQGKAKKSIWTSRNRTKTLIKYLWHTQHTIPLYLWLFSAICKNLDIYFSSGTGTRIWGELGTGNGNSLSEGNEGNGFPHLRSGAIALQDGDNSRSRVVITCSTSRCDILLLDDFLLDYNTIQRCTFPNGYIWNKLWQVPNRRAFITSSPCGLATTCLQLATSNRNYGEENSNVCEQHWPGRFGISICTRVGGLQATTRWKKCTLRFWGCGCEHSCCERAIQARSQKTTSQAILS